jgi:membrane protein implicated in regulation of membrane protease activity
MTGVAITDCDPEGQIKVKGQIWKARCAEGVIAGSTVRVTAVDGLRLDVAAA